MRISDWSSDVCSSDLYRRAQLQKMQDAVIDLEDLSSGVSIADLTLNDFRIDLAGHLRDHRDQLETLPLGTYAVVSGLEPTASDNDFPPGVIFRSDDRRVGTEWVSACSSRWSPSHKKKK